MRANQADANPSANDAHRTDVDTADESTTPQPMCAAKHLPIHSMARVLGVSASGYYDWLHRGLSKRAQANAALLSQIRAAHERSQQSYGVPRMCAELRDLGIVANKKRVERLMHQAHIQGISRRRAWTVTTRRDRAAKIPPDLVKRQFKASKPDELWVADMTYLPTWTGFAYLAVVIDVFSRKVVGWSFGGQMTSDLVTRALSMALFTRKASNVIHHSDQGSQYTSEAFKTLCANAGVKLSMGTVGDAYDNAMAESFFASLECELIHRRSWKTQREAQNDVFTWIEAWYNPHRRHSGLGQVSPNRFERDYWVQASKTNEAVRPAQQFEQTEQTEQTEQKPNELQVLP